MRNFFQNLTRDIFKAIEKSAFKVDQQNPPHLTVLNDLILHPSLFIPYVKVELRNALFFNLIYLMIFIVLIPHNFYTSLLCDNFMTIWLFLLSFFNISMIFPKILLLWKLEILSLEEDRINLSRGLWLLVRCNVFIINSKISKAIFVTHLIGLWRLLHLELDNCDLKMVYLYGILSVSFVLRVLFCVIRFHFNFSQQNLEKEEGLSLKQLNSIKIEELQNDFLEKFHGQEFCSICLEEFKVKEKIRVIACPGRHIYHVHCIDKWFISKKTCPNCNFKIRNTPISFF